MYLHCLLILKASRLKTDYVTTIVTEQLTT